MKRELFLQAPFYFFQLKTTATFFATIWFIIATILLCIPGKSLPHIGWFVTYQIDKLIHIAIFGLMSFLFCNAQYSKKWNWLIAVLCSLYGIAIEFIQENYVPNRSFDIGDIIADCIGSFAALIVVSLYRKTFKGM